MSVSLPAGNRQPTTDNQCSLIARKSTCEAETAATELRLFVEKNLSRVVAPRVEMGVEAARFTSSPQRVSTRCYIFGIPPSTSPDAAATEKEVIDTAET